MAKNKSAKPAARRRKGKYRDKVHRSGEKADVTLTGPGGRVLFSGTDAEFKAAAKRAAKVASHRVNTFKSNGGLPTSQEVAPEAIPIGEAMRLAVQELGEVVIDDKLAPQHLRQLAECYERVTEERAAFNQKNEAAKVAKKALDSATEYLLERVREFTHPTPLPLFDSQEAEEDRADMLDAVEEQHDAADADATA